MSDFLNRNTLEFRRSVNDPDYPDPPWLLVPPGSGNRTLIDTVPRRYLTLTGDVLSEMSQAEKDAVDAQILSDQRDETANRFDDVDDVTRAFALALLDELNDQHTATVNALLDAIDNASNLAGLKSDVALIQNIQTRSIAQMKAAVRNKLGT